jgi:putative Holliday junction resolvase
MGRIMGIDYGLKRVGIAVTDPLRIIVTPLVTVESQDIRKFLCDYLLKEVVDFFVVGMPINLDGQRSEIGKEVDKFTFVIKELFPDKEVCLHDERFTSKMAINTMVHFGVKKKHRANKNNIDMVSAAIILESFIRCSEN